ncbi:MAG: hypothetical protein TEF_09370 [Rhizobiales bacterium NRL2]|jgi:hypothetical protein|nr:MAG: hypothetical protein TEF_09370 [Rhizobiales bacterium NRL2]
MIRTAVIRIGLAALAGAGLAACEIVDTGAERIGGAKCDLSRATPGTPEYERCRTRSSHDPRPSERTPGGGIF